MAKFKVWLAWLVMLCFFISFVKAESFSVDPCAGNTIITQDAEKIYLDSPCFNIVFNKTYGEETPISFYDSYNYDYFDLKLHSLTEINALNTLQKRLYSFEDVSMTASVEGDKVVYTSADGKIRLLYSVQGNQVKAGFEVIGWTNYYTTSTFELRTKIHKEESANSHFINLPATVDGIEQPLVTEAEFAGENEFVVQTLYTGGSFSFLEIDPLYQVDYTPIPAKYLINGDVEVYSDTQFSSTQDITTEMSDNLTVTSFTIDDSLLNGDAIAGAWSISYQSGFRYFLRYYKTSNPSNTMYVYAYQNSTHVSSNFSSHLINAGLGWQNVEVTPQLDYQTNTLGFNFTRLRMFTASACGISELRLREEINDTQSPTIHDCWIEESPIYCNGQATWYCNVTDNLDVQSVTFTINDTNYSAIQNDSIWYYTIQFSDEFSPISENLTLTDVYAEDILNLTNHTTENLTIWHDCARIRLVHPLPATVYDEGYNLPVVLDLIHYNLDTYYVNFTCPLNGTIVTVPKEDFSNGLTSDNFDSDTEGTKWVHAEIKESGQTCDTDIDGTVPNKMSFVVDANSTPSTVQCGYNSIPLVDGNYDAQLDFNFTHIEQDTYLTFRSAPTDTLSAFGIRVFISVGKDGVGNYYTFGWNNGSSTVTQTVHVSDTYGKLRIKRSNMDEDDGLLPTFNMYFWNHTLDSWQDVVGDLVIPNTARIQYIQIKPVAEGSTYGRLELEVDNFLIETDNYTFTYVPTTTFGRVNISIFANWTTPATEVIYTWVNVSNINDAPSRPFLEAPEVDEQVDYGNYTIIWGQVIDEEGDAVKFNISLLYENYSWYSDIVTGYGNINSTSYLWDVSSIYPEGNYSMRIVVYETNTTEMLSTTETMAGTFEIINLTCMENWVAYYEACQINDSHLKYYLDDNSCGTYDDLPVDNGTWVYCNYCSEDVQPEYSACYLDAGIYIRDITYTDNNYFSCCAVTSLLSDCTILTYPYNETTQENCTVSLESDFEISLDTELLFGWGIGGLQSDKVSGKIWINDTNTTYYCLSYVETFEGNLVQTNPPYTKRTTSTIAIIPKEIEDREYFITHNGLANVYWTSDNLVLDGRQYVFGVECAGVGNNLKSEILAQVGYSPVNSPITRLFWFKDNAVAIILLLLILFIIVMLVGLYFRQVRT